MFVDGRAIKHVGSTSVFKPDGWYSDSHSDGSIYRRR